MYENTQRLSFMGSDFYSLVNPYYTAPSIPAVTGLHLYSYSLDFMCLDPLGSTNYGKLTNISLSHTVSLDASNVATLAGANAVGNQRANSYVNHVTVINNNIIRISGGALGFPVL